MTMDEAIFFEADELLVECESYISQAKSTLAVLPFSAINEWRTKRKDEQLLQKADVLQPRIQASEKSLRTILETTAGAKEVLRNQAKELQLQLNSCIEKNKEELNNSEPLVNQLRDVVDIMSSQSSSVKFMLQFNDEVARQRISEEATRERQAQAPWSIRMPNSILSSGESFDVSGDEDHINLASKLAKLRAMREQAMATLAVVLEQKESCTQSLSGCCTSKDAIDGIVRRSVRSSSSSESSSSAQVSPESPNSPDTLQVTKVLSSSEHCVEKFEAAQKAAGEATKRLQKLVEVRERILELEDSLGNAAE